MSTVSDVIEELDDKIIDLACVRPAVTHYAPARCAIAVIDLVATDLVCNNDEHRASALAWVHDDRDFPTSIGWCVLALRVGSGIDLHVAALRAALVKLGQRDRSTGRNRDRHRRRGKRKPRIHRIGSAEE